MASGGVGIDEVLSSIESASQLRTYARKQVGGDARAALALLEGSWQRGMRFPVLAKALIREYLVLGELDAADRFVEALTTSDMMQCIGAVTVLAEKHAEAGHDERAKTLLDRLPPPHKLTPQQAFDATKAECLAGRHERAHQLFVRAGDLVHQDSQALFAFAKTKLHLSKPPWKNDTVADEERSQRFARDAAEFLKRVIQVEPRVSRRAWAWYELGKALSWSKAPREEIVAAYAAAVELDPAEARFTERLRRWQQGP